MVQLNCENFNAVRTIKGVLHVPRLKINLLSVSKMTKMGLIFTCSQQGCGVYDEDCTVQGQLQITKSNMIGI
jgi:hypothetical protein